MKKYKNIFLLFILIGILFADDMKDLPLEFKDFTNASGQLYKKAAYSNGVLVEEYLFLDGLTYVRKYDPKTKALTEEGAYITENIRHGDWKQYGPSGNVLKITSYERGFEVIPGREITTIYTSQNIQTTKVVDYFPDNQIREIRYFASKDLAPIGLWEYYASQNNTIFLSKQEKYFTPMHIQTITYHMPSDNTTNLVMKSIATIIGGVPDNLHAIYDVDGSTVNAVLFEKGIAYPLPSKTNRQSEARPE